MKILLIEDDTGLAANIKEELRNYYLVDIASNGLDGAYLAQVNSYTAILIDLSLPDISGIEICRMARASNVTTPIIIFTEGESLAYKVSSIDAGADDYLTKPFSLMELVVRLKALIRRAYNTSYSNVLTVNNLCIDTNTRTVKRASKVIELKRKEYELLEFLVINKNKNLSKEILLDNVWEKGLDTCSNTLEVHIKRLRDKLDKSHKTKLIETVFGFGYRIVDKV